MNITLDGVVVGAIGSLLAAFLISILLRTKAVLFLLGISARLAVRLRSQRITRLTLSRGDYPSRLPNYLERAKQSIEIVSISLKLTQDEGDLLALFRRQLHSNPDFRIVISLMNPSTPYIDVASVSLDLTPDELREEIETMLRKLIALKESLSKTEQIRFQILVHDSFPMGSAILLDATPTSGSIQVETKLYRTPRTESFGYEVTAPSRFFTQNYRAWKRVIDDSYQY